MGPVPVCDIKKLGLKYSGMQKVKLLEYQQHQTTVQTRMFLSCRKIGAEISETLDFDFITIDGGLPAAFFI